MVLEALCEISGDFYADTIKKNKMIYCGVGPVCKDKIG